MASKTNDSSDEMITGINVTPLVDVVLVLLVIFMITAPVLYQSAIRVELPKAASGEKTEHITLKFTMLKDGTIALGNERISRDQVVDVVKKSVQTDPTANAVIAAESSLPHGEVIGFIDLLKTNGLTRFAIGVDTPPQTQNKK